MFVCVTMYTETPSRRVLGTRAVEACCHVTNTKQSSTGQTDVMSSTFHSVHIHVIAWPAASAATCLIYSIMSSLAALQDPPSGC